MIVNKSAGRAETIVSRDFPAGLGRLPMPATGGTGAVAERENMATIRKLWGAAAAKRFAS